MTENELSKIIVDLCFKVHKTLGPGLFDSVYEEVLCIELNEATCNTHDKNQLTFLTKASH